MRHIKTILLLAILTLTFSGCAIYHHYGEYSGKIVDAETKQPLEGAVVLAKYYTWLWGSPGGPASQYLDAQETVTDKNGEFRIPSLNSFAFRPLATFEPEPGFTIFKPRYTCYKRPITVDSHVTIELRELRTNKERIDNVGCFPGNVPDQKMKRLIEVNNIEAVSLGLQPSHL